MAESVKDLEALTDDELRQRHDAMAPHTEVGANWYQDELSRRETRHATEAMLQAAQGTERLTRQLV